MRSTVTLRVPEERLATAGALGAVLIAVPAGVIALTVVSAGQALTVAGGAGVVAVLALSALPLYRFGGRVGTDRVGNEVFVVMALVALAQRLMLGAGIFAAVWRLTDVPMRALAAGLAVGLVASIIAEMVTAARDPRFFWVDAAAGTSPLPPRGPLNTSGTERQHA